MCEDVLVRSRLLMLLPFCCSSVKAVDKREGAGAHNWGTMKDDIETYDFLVNALRLFQFKRLIRQYTFHTLVTRVAGSLKGILLLCLLTGL